MKSFETVQAAKRFCTTNNLGCYNPLIVAKSSTYFVFLSGEPVGEFDNTSKFTRWEAGSYQLAARFQTLTGKWVNY